METHIANWNVIENWINSQYPKTSFSRMPMKACLDKETCKKIMQGKLFGYDSNDIYDIKYLPEPLKSDTEIAILAIELYSNNFFEISQSLQASVDFHQLLVQNSNVYYEYIFGHSPLSIRGNKDFVSQIISNFPMIYCSISPELQSDRKILFAALKKKFFSTRMPKYFSTDKKVVLKLIENASVHRRDRYEENGFSFLMSFISKELLSDRDILLKFFTCFKCTLEIPDSLKTDKEVIIYAVKSNPSFYESIYNKLKTDHEIALEAFKGDPKLFIKYIGKNHYKLKTILEFVKSLKKPINPYWAVEFEGNSRIFEEILDGLVVNNMLTDEIVLHLISIWPNDLKFYKYFKCFSPDLKKDKRVVSLLLHTSVSEKGMTFHSHQEVFKDFVTTQYVYENYIKPYYPNDKELILNAMYKAPSLFDGIPEILKSDEEIILETSRFLLKGKRDEFLDSLPFSYRNNKSFILKLLEIHLSADFDESIFEFASKELRDDEIFVKEAIKIQPQSVMYASERLRDDLAIQKLAFLIFREVLKALRVKYGKAKSKFDIDSFDGKSNRELDLQFLNKHCKKLLSNRNFFLWLAETKVKKKLKWEFYDSYYDSLSYQELFSISDAFSDDRKIMIKAIKENAANFVSASSRLKADKNLALLMIDSFNAEVLKNKDNFEFDFFDTNSKISSDPQDKLKELFLMVDPELRIDEEFCKVALSNNVHLIELINSNLLDDTDRS